MPENCQPWLGENGPVLRAEKVWFQEDFLTVVNFGMLVEIIFYTQRHTAFQYDYSTFATKKLVIMPRKTK